MCFAQYTEVLHGSPQKYAASDDGRSEYAASDTGSSPVPSPDDAPTPVDIPPSVFSAAPLSPIVNGKKRQYHSYSEIDEDAPCRICKKDHAPGDCAIRNDPRALLAIEQMILSKDNNEPPEVKVIDLTRVPY